MSKLLDSLLEEYAQLKAKLDKVIDLIKIYGGKVPSDRVGFLEHLSNEIRVLDNKKEMDKEEEFQHRANRLYFTTMGHKIDYPVMGTWKEKILYILREEKTPMTAKEIASKIDNHELGRLSMQDRIKYDVAHTLRMVTQYTSVMGNNNDIGVDNTEFRNKYYLKYDQEIN